MQQTVAVEDLVVQPDRLKEFARHRCQDGFVCHCWFLGCGALVVEGRVSTARLRGTGWIVEWIGKLRVARLLTG